MKTIEVNVVIGSWGSYNACNERALGSSWLNLVDYSDWDEIADELTNQGFDLDGIDEELFIQDIEGFSSCSCSWDFMHPKRLFNVLLESEVLKQSYKYDLFMAYLEVSTLEDFFELVDSNGSNWDSDIYIYSGYDWADYGREIFTLMIPEVDNRLLEHIDNFFDFSAYGEYMGADYAQEYSDGIIEIRR